MVVDMNNPTSGPLVSIVIPTYNHAPLLRRAIESILAQTFSDWKAIVVNNFSTDDTISVVESFSDDRIQIVNFANNGSIAASRNKGISIADGTYVAFLDSDDTWFPKKLELCINALNAGADLVCHGEFWVGQNGSRREVAYGPKNKSTYAKLLYRGNRISTSATVIRRSILDACKGFDESSSLISTEDYDLWMRIAQLTPHLEFIAQPLGEYHLHESNVSGNIERHLAAELAVLAKHFPTTQRSIPEMIRQRKRIGIALYGAGRSLQRTGNYRASIKLFAQSAMKWPFSIRLAAAALLLLRASVAPRR
jgi:glycosyltransferase involved in cell wall biosynthesis